MDEAVRIEVTGRVDGKIARSIRDIAKASNEADIALDALREALTSFTPGQHLKAATNDYRELRNEINRVKQTQQTLVNSNKTTASSFQAAAASATKYGQSVRQVEAANGRAVGSFSTLRSAISTTIGLFGGLFAFRGYMAAQDTLTTVQNQIKVIATGTEHAAALQRTLFDLSNRTRSDIGATTAAYVNFYKNLAPLGAKQEEVLRIVETLNKGFIVGGKSAAEAAGSTRQFVQGLQNGALRGEEFNSVMEAFPKEIIEEFAKSLGVSSLELRTLAADGKITAEVIRESMGNAAKTVDELFARMTPTIDGALTVLNNKFVEFTANTAGFAGMLANAIIFLGDQLHIVIPIVALFAAGWAAVGIVRITGEILSLTRTVAVLAGSLLVTHGVLLLWVGVFALVGAAIVSLIYMVAQLMGKGDEFEEWLAGGIITMKGWLDGVLGMAGGTKEAAAAGETLKSELANVSAQIGQNTIDVQGLTGATNDNSKALNENKNTARAWASHTTKAIEEVAFAYEMLSRAQKDALAVGATKHYAQLQAAGGSSGSFTAVGKGTNAGSVTTLPAFARGGSMTVGGRPGVDRNVVPIRVSRGERVDVLTPAQQRAQRAAMEQGQGGPPTFIFNVTTPDADSFRKSRGQIASDMIAALL